MTSRSRPARGAAAAPARSSALVVLVPAVLALVCAAAFLPALQNGFVDWDDDSNFLENEGYRGLGWSQLRWMLTATLNGLYIPLTWITLGFDYVVSGMNPAGYHATSLIFHVAVTVAFYFLARRLLALARPPAEGDGRWGMIVGAATAALLFAVHPLRVESVAWITERRDVVSGLCSVLAVIAYLRYAAAPAGPLARRWYGATLVAVALALLSKPMAVTLPIVFAILDVYPLRRLRRVRDLASAEGRALVVEKVPLLLLSAGAGVATLVAASRLTHVVSTSAVGLVDRLAISAYGLAFYLWKTLVPVGLSPLYELPPRIDPTAWPFVLAAAVVIAITALAVLLRVRWPALAAVWATYVVILLPVVGIVQNGPQIAADRYTYLACAGWALLVGGAARAGWRGWREGRIAPAVAAAGAGALVVVVGALAVLTWSQTAVWRDSETLWRHAVATRPSAIVHFKLGMIHAHRGEIGRAIERFQEALRLNPAYARGHAAMGFALMFQGQMAAATQHFREAVRLDPREAEAHSGLGLALDRQGDLAGAAEHFALAIAANPRDAVSQVNLGLVRLRQGRRAEAIAHLREALRVAPGMADAHTHLGRALLEEGKSAEAAEHFRAAARR